MLENIAMDLIPSAYSLNDPLVEHDEYDDLRILIGIIDSICKRDITSNMKQLTLYHSYSNREYLVVREYSKVLYRKGYKVTEHTDSLGDGYTLISWGDGK